MRNHAYVVLLRHDKHSRDHRLNEHNNDLLCIGYGYWLIGYWVPQFVF